jgi:hypothetical protein
MVIIPSYLLADIHALTAWGRKPKNAALQNESGQGGSGGVV